MKKIIYAVYCVILMTPTFNYTRAQLSQGQIARKEQRLLQLINAGSPSPEIDQLMLDLAGNLPQKSLSSYQESINMLKKEPQVSISMPPKRHQPKINAAALREDLEDLEEQIEELGNAPKTRAAMLMFLSRIEFDINRLDNTAQQDQLSAQAQNIRIKLESPAKVHEATINTDRRLALLRGYQGHLDGIAQAIDSAQTLRTLWELSVMIDNTERQLAEQSTLLEKEDVETIGDLIKHVRTLHTTKSEELTPSPTTTEPTPSQTVYESDSDSDSDSDDDDDDDRDPWGWSNPPEPEPKDDPVASSAAETSAPEPPTSDPTPTISDEAETTPSSSDVPEADNPSTGHAEDIAESYVEGFWGSEN